MAGYEESLVGRTCRSAAEARFEYRVWDEPACCVSRLTAWGTFAGVEERTDVYLIGPDPTVNAKVRDSRLEVKRLIGSTRGLQRWRPDAPVQLPLTSEQFALLLLDLGITGSDVETWIDQERLDPRAVLSNSPTGDVVTAQKRRRRYELDAARAEFTEVDFFGRSYASIAVEAADAETVKRAKNRLGLIGENRPMHCAAAEAARHRRR